MKHQFQTIKFKADTLAVIDQANEIIAEYMAEGYDLTLRQLYYQFVARDLIPNTQQEYKKLGKIISNARLAGLIDWDAIKDRTRSLKALSHWTSPRDIIYSAAYSYRRDTRQGQETYIETWVEKEALAGVVQKACDEVDVPWFACRGYVSQTAMYEAAMRCKARKQEHVLILHLGDHDPSGMDMTNDIQNRIIEVFGVSLEVRRIALSREQVDRYGCPPNPAKLTDSRCKAYIAEHGKSSWELDALEPRVISRLIHRHVDDQTDAYLRGQQIALMEKEKSLLTECSNRWDDVVDLLENN